MSPFTVLRFNFANPGGDAAVQREAVATAMEMARWGETRGVGAISFDEHHQTGHGWSSNPILLAGMALAQTSHLIASIDCSLGPLWNPARMAEDIALVDAVSRGRLHITIGLGYRPEEYDLIGADFRRRGRLMDELLQRMLDLWADPDFTPRPFTRPHPNVYVGGSVAASARRAARFGLPLSLPAHLPEVVDLYEDLCHQQGHAPFVIMPPQESRGMVFLHEDPERAWAELGQHVVWEVTTYGSWQHEGKRSYLHHPGIDSAEAVRAAGVYRFLTPDQLLDDLRNDTTGEPLVLHPLVGGMPTDVAWQSLHLLAEQVLPALSSNCTTQAP